MIDPNSLTNEELRAEVARLQEERERTTPGWSEREVNAFSACRDVMCEGNAQRPVKAIRTTHVVSFGENGDPTGPYASTISHDHTWLRYADPVDAACPTCGLDNSDLSEQLRPSYVNIVGSQDALLRVRRAGIAEGATAESVLAAAAAAKTQQESPVEALQHRYVAGQIDDQEYAAKLAAIGQPVPALLRPAPKQPKPKPAVEPEPKAA